ncbi:RNA uridylyltransferase [Aureococcus anophagefferens]|nr:RNA uridylyltransferase [Aureococcus anophagefferens]
MDGLDDISQEEIDAFAASGQDLGPGEDSIFVAAFAEAFDHDPNVAACRPCKPAPPLMFRSPTLVYLPQKAEAEFDALAGAYSANLAPNLAPSEGRWPSDGADASGYIAPASTCGAAGRRRRRADADPEDAPMPTPDGLAPSIAARLASSDAVEAALVSVCGFVDPWSWPWRRATRRRTLRAALARALGAEQAARVADAIVRGDRPEASSSSSDDDGDGDAPIGLGPRRTSTTSSCGSTPGSAATAPCAAATTAPPRTSARGSRSPSRKRIPTRSRRAPTGDGPRFDVSRACDGDRAAADRGDAGDGTAAIEAFASARAAYAPVCRFAKVLLRQSGLDDVYGGGLGSFRCCALVAKALPNKPPGAAPRRPRRLGVAAGLRRAAVLRRVGRRPRCSTTALAACFARGGGDPVRRVGGGARRAGPRAPEAQARPADDPWATR